MPDKLTDFKLIYDPRNPVLKQKKTEAESELMDCPKAFTWYKTHMGASVYASNNVHSHIKILLGGLDHVHGVIIPTQAEFRAFNTTADLGFYRTNAQKQLVESDPSDGAGSVGFTAVKIADYYHGKARQATNGQVVFTCTITITESAWQQVERMGASPDQIKGILSQNPILISQKSKQMGVRCIKPEPYGWIFSTSVSSRLVAKNVAVTTNNPTALTFSTVESGH